MSIPEDAFAPLQHHTFGRSHTVPPPLPESILQRPVQPVLRSLYLPCMLVARQTPLPWIWISWCEASANGDTALTTQCMRNVTARIYASGVSGVKMSQHAMNSAAMAGPITNPVRPNRDMPPSVEIRTM